MEKNILLENIGVTQENRLDARFESMCEKLIHFKKLNGHCIVPLNEGRNMPLPLGLWAQRMRLKMSAGELSEERKNRLLDIGLPENNKEARFLYSLALAKQYLEENGHLNVPQSYQKNGYNLGKWINRMRVCYAKNELSQNRIRQLETLGMVWKAV